jgi:uncharacterized protein YggE
MRPLIATRPAAVFAAAALLISLTSPLRAEDKPMDRLITVSATGYAYAEPDRARVSSGVASEAETARAALTANTEKMKQVVAGLKEAGIDAKDIQTSNFSVEPRYTNPQDGTPSKIDGYRVSNQVTILVRDVSAIGTLLDKLASVGANQIYGLTFEVSKAETLKDDARKEAVANARRRAELLATAAGAEVGEVVSIAEDLQFTGPRPMAMARASMKADFVPVEAGTETLEARVTVTWKLK